MGGGGWPAEGYAAARRAAASARASQLTSARNPSTTPLGHPTSSQVSRSTTKRPRAEDRGLLSLDLKRCIALEVGEGARAVGRGRGGVCCVGCVAAWPGWVLKGPGKGECWANDAWCGTPGASPQHPSWSLCTAFAHPCSCPYSRPVADTCWLPSTHPPFPPGLNRRRPTRLSSSRCTTLPGGPAPTP